MVGGVLRTVQYAGQVSLWHDELAIARNIADRSARELIARPLDHRQVAPAGFLVSVKAATAFLGVNELGLRLVPWLAGVLSLPLFWRVALRFTSGPPLVAAVAMFAVSPALIWYGASVKQYGTDLTVSLLLVWLALRVHEQPTRVGHAAGAGVAGGAALLFSHPAVVSAAILGCMLLPATLGRRRSAARHSIAILGVCWGAAALAATALAVSLLDGETAQFMEGFWREGFPPPLSEPVSLLTWVPRQLFSAFAHFLLFITPLPLILLIVVPVAAAAVVGFATVVRRQPWQTALLSAPILGGLAAAIAGLLPFRHRLALHAVWPVLVFAAVGLEALEDRLHARHFRVATAGTVLVAAPLASIVLLAARPPYDSGQETRPVVEALARRWKDGDGLYASCGARHAIAFYGPRSGLSQWRTTDCAIEDPREALRDVDQFRGWPRVWFFSMLFPNENASIVRSYLTAIGRQEDVISGAEIAGQGGRII